VFTTDRLSRDEIRAYLESDKAVVLVAEDALAGAAIVELHGSAARLVSMAVAPDYRRRHIGKFLLMSAEASAREHGCTLMWLEVRSDNVPAIALYTCKGYNKCGRRKRYYEDGCDAVVFVKVL